MIEFTEEMLEKAAKGANELKGAREKLEMSIGHDGGFEDDLVSVTITKIQAGIICALIDEFLK